MNRMNRTIRILLMLGCVVLLSSACTKVEHADHSDAATVVDHADHDAMDHHKDMAHGEVDHMHHDMDHHGDDHREMEKVPYTKPPLLKSPQELIGKKLPAIPLDGSDGSQAKLQTVDGKPTVLVMWSTWCQACLHETHELVDWADGRDDVAFLPININGISGEPADVPLVLQYAQKVGLTGPVWITDADNLSGLGVQTCPTSFVVAGDGTVKAARVGYNGRADMDRWLDQNLRSL